MSLNHFQTYRLRYVISSRKKLDWRCNPQRPIKRKFPLSLCELAAELLTTSLFPYPIFNHKMNLLSYQLFQRSRGIQSISNVSKVRATTKSTKSSIVLGL